MPTGDLPGLTVLDGWGVHPAEVTLMPPATGGRRQRGRAGTGPQPVYRLSPRTGVASWRMSAWLKPRRHWNGLQITSRPRSLVPRHGAARGGSGGALRRTGHPAPSSVARAEGVDYHKTVGRIGADSAPLAAGNPRPCSWLTDHCDRDRGPAPRASGGHPDGLRGRSVTRHDPGGAANPGLQIPTGMGGLRPTCTCGMPSVSMLIVYRPWCRS